MKSMVCRAALALLAAGPLMLGGCKSRDAARAPAVDPVKPAAPAQGEGAADAPAAPEAPEAPAATDTPGPDGADLVQAAVALTDSAETPADVAAIEPPPADPAAALDEGTPEQLLALKAGNEALMRGDSAQALVGFIEAFDGPTTGASISAGLAAAELHDQAGRTAEAGAVYDRLLQMAPEVAEIRFVVGRFQSASGQPKKAVEQLTKAIDLEPDFLPAYPMLGGILASTGAAGRSAELMLTYETRLKGLIDKLADPQVRDHRKVPIIDVMALVDDDRVSRALIAAVGSDSMHVRLAAAEALTHDADPAALEAIAKAALAERDPIARRALAASLKAAKKRFDESTRTPTPAMPPPQP